MKTTSRDNTHKNNITNKIFNLVGIPSSLASNLVDDIISIITINIIKKKYLKIKNFGSFNLKKKNSRIGRNPKNKIDHEISERNVLTFKASSKLSRKANSNDEK
jgi:integration host factor subunit alpha